MAIEIFSLWGFEVEFHAMTEESIEIVTSSCWLYIPAYSKIKICMTSVVFVVCAWLGIEHYERPLDQHRL